MISDGAHVNSGEGDIFAGKAIISGAGSVWNSTNRVDVGFFSGANGELEITDGGLLSAGGAIRVEASSPAYVSKLTVTGNGSQINDSNSLDVGRSQGTAKIAYWTVVL